MTAGEGRVTLPFPRGFLRDHRTNAAAATFACFIGCIISGGPILVSTFGTFLLPVTHAFGWQRAAFAAVLTIVSIATTIAFPIAGRLLDRYGARPVVLIGTLLFGLSTAALSLVPPDPAVAYLLFAVAGFFSAFPSSVLYTKVISTWFLARRGLMLGLAIGTGSAFGYTVMPVVSAWLMRDGDWRAAYFGLGAIVVLIGLPIHALGLREGRQHATDDTVEATMDQGLRFDAAIRTRAFWWLLAAISVGAGSLTALFTHVVPILVERGIPEADALGVLSIYAITSSIAQSGLGFLLDRSNSPRFAALAILASAAGVLIFASSEHLAPAILAGMLLGVGTGTEYALLPFCIPRYFGLGAYGVIFGTIFAVITLFTGFTPLIMDLIYDRAGDYRWAFVMIGASLSVCGLLVTTLPRWAAGPLGARAHGAVPTP